MSAHSCFWCGSLAGAHEARLGKSRWVKFCDECWPQPVKDLMEQFPSRAREWESLVRWREVSK